MGTANSAYVTDVYNPREAIREGISNAFSWTWLRLGRKTALPPPSFPPVIIELHAGTTGKDMKIIDNGLGWESFNRVRQSGIYAATKEEAAIIEERRRDPNYIGKFGVGINSLLSLSQTGEIEIRSVTEDNLGRRAGFICDLVFIEDRLGNKVVQYSDPEILDSKYIKSEPGCIITIKNLTKRVNKKSIIEYLSGVFYRKFTEGFQIWIRDLAEGSNRNFERILGRHVCTTCEKQIGILSNGYPVFADIHKLEDNKGTPAIDILIKKVGGLGILPLDRMATGFVWTAGILPKLGRDNIMDSQESPYSELLEMIDNWCQNSGIPNKSDMHENDQLRNAKRVKELASQVITKFYRKHPELVPPALRAHFAKDQLQATLDELDKGWRNRKKPEKKDSKKKSSKKTDKKYRKHRHRNRKPILAEGENSIIDMDVDKESRPGGEVCWIDAARCAFMINSATPNSPIYQTNFGQLAWNQDLVTTYMLMATLRIGYEDQPLSAEDMMRKIGEFFGDVIN